MVIILSTCMGNGAAHTGTTNLKACTRNRPINIFKYPFISSIGRIQYLLGRIFYFCSYRYSKVVYLSNQINYKLSDCGNFATTFNNFFFRPL